MGEQSGDDQHEEDRRVATARCPEPRFGEDRQPDPEELQLGIHACVPAVDDLERAQRHHRGGQHPGPTPIAHPPRNEREGADGCGDSRGPEPERVDAEPGEREVQEVVERRMRVVRPQEREQRTERQPPGHGGERLVVAQPVRPQAPEAQHRTRDHQPDEHPVRRTHPAWCNRFGSRQGRRHDPTLVAVR